MLKIKKSLLFLATVILLSVLIPNVSAAIKTFTVFPGEQMLLSINLDDNSYVSGIVDASGGIDFWVTDPQNATILDLGAVYYITNFNFTSHGSGVYILHFGNPGNLSYGYSIPKASVVTLSLEVPTQSSVISLVIPIAVVAVVIGAVSAGVLRYRRKKRVGGLVTPSTVKGVGLNCPPELIAKIKEIDRHAIVPAVLLLVGISLVLVCYVTLSLPYSDIQDFTFRYPFLDSITDPSVLSMSLLAGVIMSICMYVLFMYYLLKRRKLVSIANRKH
jgi:hypothetical protein